MFGSFALRELYPHLPLIQKLFGGLNILIFWVIGVLLLYFLDRWISGNKRHISEAEPSKKNIFLTKRVALLTLVFVFLFFGSLKVFHGHAFILFWLAFISLLWIIGILLEHRRKGKNLE
jgi:hypothetical protein